MAEVERIREFEGPSQLLDAVKELKDPEVDGAIVRSLVAPDFASSLTENGTNDTYAGEAFSQLAEIVPQVKGIDEIVESAWDELGFAGFSLRAQTNGRSFRTNNSKPHIDFGVFIVDLIPPTPLLFYGPVFGSLGLVGAAKIGLERLPKSDFIDNDGHLDIAKARIIKRAIDTPEVQEIKLRSNVDQAAGDLLLLVLPLTKHSVEITDEPRVALTMFHSYDFEH